MSFDALNPSGPRHGSPADRGSADAYYGRAPNPHYYVGATGSSPRVGQEDMTPEEVQEYMDAYENEDMRKEW